MEQINSETIISSLLVAGYDQVDTLLYTYLVGKLSIDDRKSQVFEFIENDFSKTFEEYIQFDGIKYKLKEGYNINSNIKVTKDDYYPLRKLLKTNNKLIEYINSFDLRDIVIKKISILGQSNKEMLKGCFSNKEKEVIIEMFNLNQEENNLNNSYQKTLK